MNPIRNADSSNGARKIIFALSTVALFLGFAPEVFAQGFVPLAPIPGLTQGITADQTGLANFFNNLYKFAIGLAAALAVIMIIWGGLEYATQDSISKKSDGKERIYNAIFGLILVLAPALVFAIINPSILNLSINLPKLDTATTPLVAPTNVQTVRGGTILNAAKVGQVIGFGDGYYPATAAGVYCYPIKPFTESGVVKNFGCSADPNGCRNMFNSEAPKNLPADSSCTKY
ncbi:MAG: pilin [bacterium]|nr:pilin [bacterium]